MSKTCTACGGTGYRGTATDEQGNTWPLPCQICQGTGAKPGS